MTNQTLPSTNPISIKLTESAVFLRSRKSSHDRRRAAQPETPTILRGLLVLNFEKAVKVSEIIVKLTCSCFATWQEGVELGKIDVTEEAITFKAEQTFFRASRNDRRRASLPPAIPSNQRAHDSFLPFRDQVPTYTPTTPHERPRPHRRLSTDLTNFQHEALSRSETRYSPPSTPSIGTNCSDSQGLLNEMGRDQRSPIVSFDPSTFPPGEASAPLRSHSARLPSSHGVPERASGPSVTCHLPSTSFPGNFCEASLHSQSNLFSDVPIQRGQDEDRSRRPNTGFSVGTVSHSILNKIHPSTHDHSASLPQNQEHSPSRGRSRTNVLEERLKQKEGPGIMVVEKIERYLSKRSDDMNWKEFKPGVHTYAISIPIPADQPPSVECPFGKVSWRLKATVHRPGTFTPKYQHSMNITVVHNPIEEDQAEPDSITIERHWDRQLQYMFSLPSRHFYIGGSLPFSLTLLPHAKVRIHGLTVYIEERVNYSSTMPRVTKSSPRAHVVLLTAKSNDGKPILPIESDDPIVLRNSPLHQFLGEGEDISEQTSFLMGLGPWTIRKDLELPASCSLLHWSHLNKKSTILISHILKCIIRVERGDDCDLDKSGKRKLYDIITQTPINIGSCYCNPNWAGLPPYSKTSQDTRTFEDKCPCEIFGKRHGFTRHVVPRHSTDPETPTAETSGLEATMLSLRGSDAFYRNNVQYERLVSGQEGESGEVPPPYPPA
ncbi:hypothetical protein DL96DRAFT_1621654 [Flagelloscypha sp. PMI_526]|nr:hypothetical protein DL96DRAFT_1621654 [Flagelloscypha sp. PMI_526]